MYITVTLQILSTGHVTEGLLLAVHLKIFRFTHYCIKLIREDELKFSRRLLLLLLDR